MAGEGGGNRGRIGKDIGLRGPWNGRVGVGGRNCFISFGGGARRVFQEGKGLKRGKGGGTQVLFWGETKEVGFCMVKGGTGFSEGKRLDLKRPEKGKERWK